MVTCKADTVAVPKMNSVRSHKAPSSNNASGLRLLDCDRNEASSSVSRNSVYKLKIDLLFDDTSRSIRNNRLDDIHGSHRTRSIIMYGRSELESSIGEKGRPLANYAKSKEAAGHLADNAKKDVQRISNTVQEQIEQLFTDVANDATSSFAVTCLGFLPLKDKVTSLQGLQQPLRALYLNERINENHNMGTLDICTTGLRIKAHAEANCNSERRLDRVTPFHNIAVWSAVKFVVSEEDGGAAFLPLITDPDNIDKASLFHPLSYLEKTRLANNRHAPIFAVVMRSPGVPKVLECHGFICKTTEDAIVIAATLYQSLMAHVNSNSHRSTKRRTPRNQNGVSCVSIASSSALTGSNYMAPSQVVSGGRKSSFRSSSGSVARGPAMRSVRKKRTSNSSLGYDAANKTAETTTEERKRKSHKTKRAPSAPINAPGTEENHFSNNCKILENCEPLGRSNKFVTNADNNYRASDKSYQRSHRHVKRNSSDSVYRSSEKIVHETPALAVASSATQRNSLRKDTNGDILTRVAIPRSGSFLNTGGLTRYKSRATRRNSGKLGGGGGGSPLGFSELFNEFRLHENLHSLDDILSVIIDSDGMSFNDLKPIYKEFLLKLAVTLTKDELFQRSKNIMRRQRKKKQSKQAAAGTKTKSRTLAFGTKSLKKVLQFGQFRSCRKKLSKPAHNKELDFRQKPPAPNANTTTKEPHQMNQQRNRVTTSGSDVSVVRNDNVFPGFNRNSSSGYVSCSECSYDSEACTCNSADRCYCSLRNRTCKSKIQSMHKGSNPTANRLSLLSCKSDDKCYCSILEEGPSLQMKEETCSNSDTTWCDTDSCVSASKCYCKRTDRRSRFEDNAAQYKTPRPHHAATRKPADKLALDYELFTISGNGKTVQPHEALSVKKSVEAAAVFADVKLSQTTDIKSFCPSSVKDKSFVLDQKSEKKLHTGDAFDKLCNKNDLLSKINAIESNVENASSVKNEYIKNSQLASSCRGKDPVRYDYQSMKAVGASLEDTLGYLP